MFPNVCLPDKCYLVSLREMLAKHQAFKDNNCHLERLALKYNVKIIWCPKFHCELNPIEGVWCDYKRFIRANSEQKFEQLKQLLIEAQRRYQQKGLSIKLWYRFWRAIDMYENNCSYVDVLHDLFGAKSSATIKTKKKIKDFNTNI